MVKTNLEVNTTFYDSTLTQTIINSGYAGNEDNLSDSASAKGTLNLGYEVIGETGAAQINVVNTAAGIHSMNTAVVTDFGTASSANTKSSFRIVGVSVNASTFDATAGDLVNFHIDGRRFANSEINNFGVSGFTGMDGFSQNVYVTSIGKWKPSNNYYNSSHSSVSVYPYGSGDWDGDIAELLVFNKKLSNTNISRVEGYLAHKYGLQDNLIHKDGATNSANVYNWNFANTHDGWAFVDNQTTQNPLTTSFKWYTNDTVSTIVATASGADTNAAMEIFLPRHIDGTYYNTFHIKYARSAAGTGTAAHYYNLAWKNTDSETLHEAATFSDPGGTSWQTKSADLSSNANWFGKKIKYLRFNFNRKAAGSQVHDVEYAYVSGSNFTHPYKYTAPPALGANTMDNTSY